MTTRESARLHLLLGRTDYRALCRWWNQLTFSQWPDGLPGKPQGFDSFNEEDTSIAQRPLRKAIGRHIVKYET